MSSSDELAKEVEAVLARRAVDQGTPTDIDLFPVYNLLLNSSKHASTSSGPSGSSRGHWYCSKASSTLHREAATYLIILFAFRREGMSATWVTALEGVLMGCDDCARAFGSARRTFGARYLSNRPLATRNSFFGAVDKWQAGFILSENAKSSEPAYGSNSQSNDLVSLPSSILQLFLAEPSLLDIPELSAFLDSTTSASASRPPQSHITTHGLTPILIRLLSSPDNARRNWALAQLPAAAWRPLSFQEWRDNGIGDELRRLYEGDLEVEPEARWEAIKAILKSNSLSREAVQDGLLGAASRRDQSQRSDWGVMVTLSGLLGSETDYFKDILECFALLLELSPTRHIWAFDSSPELPHTLFAEIKNNPSFHHLLADRCISKSSTIPISPPADEPSCERKGKRKVDDRDTPLSWITPFLMSLAETGDVEQNALSSEAKETGFAEALAQATSFCFQDMQHGRFAAELRAAAAQAGTEATFQLQQRLEGRQRPAQYKAMSDTLELHAKFINAAALSLQEHPMPAWSTARNSARSLLAQAFRADGHEIIHGMLALAAIAFEEKKRHQKAKKAKGDVPPPVPVDLSHLPVIRKELWARTYDAALPADVAGAAILMNSIAPFAHIDKLDRHEVWAYDEVAKVVKEDDWTASIRAINVGLENTRHSFATALELISLQSNEALIRSLWRQEGVAKSAIILLLSPVEEIHDPVISLVQHSFEDVDDRGDCFHVLLKNHPDVAIEGLTEFLQTFIETARITPDSCGLAKWLVRCFTDVLEALCGSTESSEPLLQYQAFLSSHSDGRPMNRRISDLWHLMTTSLAVIFKRTPTWATLYASEIMVDWMRDALIFGRQMTEYIRAFEAAALGQTASNANFSEMIESPAKTTSVGKMLVHKLEVVLEDLVSWLRLTDLETLHQTFELIKTILGRINKSNPDLSKAPKLEATLCEIDKFSRRAGKNYRTRLSDDLLSELADLLVPFDLDLTIDDEVRYVRTVDRPSASVTPDVEPTGGKVGAPRVDDVKHSTAKNAFEEMMKKASSSKGPAASAAQRSKAAKPASGSSKQASIDVDDFDDDFLSTISKSDLDIIEKRARLSTGLPSAPLSSLPQSQKTYRPPQPSGNISLNAVPKRVVARRVGGTGFKSEVMRNLRFEHRQQITERKRTEIGGIAPRLPAASALGTGLGAYQGERRKIQPVESSGSSASDTSADEENQGISALVRRQKSPKNLARILPVEHRRPIKILGSSIADVVRQREDRRASQHAIKHRLRPDLNPLYRYVLAWNPDHAGPMAPHPQKHAAELAALKPVPTTFASSKYYEQIMLPLYLQELWSQCIKQKPTSPPLSVEISTRTYEDDFLDIELTVQGNVPFDFYANESDVVTLRKPGARPVFAKVQGFRKKFKETGLKVRIMVVTDQKELAGKSRWQLQKHLSLSTAFREFAALRGLPFYEHEMLADILAARSAVMPRISEQAVDNAKKAFDVNEPQARAILGAMDVRGFALIQGPPGTGKTKTISGLVGRFMSDRSSNIPTAGEKSSKVKLLVCAPSNAAIDEVCKRLMNGVPSSNGGRHNPIIVRIGIDSSVNIAVKDISLDSLVEARVNSETSAKNGGGGYYARIQAELDDVKQAIRLKQDELKDVQGHDEKRKTVENEYHTLITRRTQLGQQSSKAKDAARDATRHLEGARRAARDAVLNEADIICATLSSAGQDSLAPYTFETVIIDEAAQAIEMSCLIPLKYGCKRCIMVGDPNQLPPTTFSCDAERLHYNESLFVRIAKQNPSNVQLLSIQYRMHPNISELPSKVFYNGHLKDGPDMARNTAALWHARNVYGPYRFFNVEGIEMKAGTSTKNPQEALVAVELYRRLEADFGSKVNLALRIGVITMYKEQLWEMKRKFTDAFGPVILEKIEFNTVDGFQGQEKDIIILSCVRSGPNLRSIGFLKDARRMNVALTRAKSSLFVIGNGPTLERSDERWRTIVGDARQRGFFVNYGPTTFAPEANESPYRKIKKERPPTPSKKPSIPTSPAHHVDAKPPKLLVAELKRKSSLDLAKRVEKRMKVEDDVKASGRPLVAKKVSSSQTPVGKAKEPKLPPVGTRADRQQPSASSSSPAPKYKGLPPSNPAPPHGMPPARPAEDILFINKKKRNKAGGPNGAVPGVRAAINDRLHGRQ